VRHDNILPCSNTDNRKSHARLLRQNRKAGLKEAVLRHPHLNSLSCAAEPHLKQRIKSAVMIQVLSLAVTVQNLVEYL